MSARSGRPCAWRWPSTPICVIWRAPIPSIAESPRCGWSMKTRPKLLVIDDGDRHIELLHHFLRDYAYATRCDLPGPCWTCPQRLGCSLTHAPRRKEADEALRRNPDTDVVLLDVAFDLPARPTPAVASRWRPDSAADGAIGDERSLDLTRRLQGLAILSHLRRTRGDLPVVLMTAPRRAGL